jgi:segregation and condensation protein B
MHSESQPDDALVRRIVEAALFAASQPQSLAQLVALFPEDAPAPAESIEKALDALREESVTRGVELVEVASGFRFQVRSEVQPWVARLWAERQTRYSRALLETLALIAYRQPITRGEIEQIRGVAVSTQIVRTLEEREWIRVVGHRDVPGKPALFGTTRGFLDYFGLKSLDQLPPLTELHDIPDLEPQLALEPITAAAPSLEGLEPSAPLLLHVEHEAQDEASGVEDEEQLVELTDDDAEGTEDTGDDDNGIEPDDDPAAYDELIAVDGRRRDARDSVAADSEVDADADAGTDTDDIPASDDAMRSDHADDGDANEPDVNEPSDDATAASSEQTS